MARRLFNPVLVVLLLAGCATSSSQRAHAPRGSHGDAAPPQRPSFRVVFNDGYAYARENGHQWRISEVTRNEMLWAPDGTRFAYVLPVNRLSKQAKQPAGTELNHQVVVRNIRGDSVNAFAVYRPGRPEGLDWLDDRHICYRAPPDRSGAAYVVHSVETGEILSVHRGESFVWSPGKKRLAYVAGRERQVIRVDSEQVWPRVDRTRKQRKIVSDLVWSPNGEGLAFLESNGRKARLVVLLVVDDHNGDLTWELPRQTRDRDNKLFWAESQVLIGESTFKPRFAASWNRVR